MQPSKNSPFGVDLKPFTPFEQVVFTLALETSAPAAFADCGTPILEVHSPVINRRNYKLSFAIREAVLLISNSPNKPVVE